MEYILDEEVRQKLKSQIYTKIANWVIGTAERGNPVPSIAAQHNYALSLLNIEYHKLGKEDREEVLSRYGNEEESSKVDTGANEEITS